MRGGSEICAARSGGAFKGFGQKLFGAAFSSNTLGAFELACAGEVKSALGAEAAAIVLVAAAGDGVSVRATSEVASSLLERFCQQPELWSTAVSGPVFGDLNDASIGVSLSHDAAAKNAGFSGYLSVPLRLENARRSAPPVAVIVIYFSSVTDLQAKYKLFSPSVRATIAAALAARRDALKSITPNSFSSLAETIPGVVYQRIVRPDGDIRYTYLSEGARELFGVDPAAVIQDPDVLFRTFAEDYRKTFRERLVEASASLTKWDVEASVVMPDGRTRTTHAIARPERLEGGAVLWTGVILDASRAKEAEEGLKEANRLVGLANQAKSAFLAKMSHEMRTPLNGVLGMGDLLLKTELSPRQNRLATTLCDSARGLLGIINDVLDLSRIEAGHFKLDVQDFNLRHCVEDAVELCATGGYRKGLEVNLIVAKDTPIGVKSDPVRLRQVLINLIGNSIKFTETGEIVVRMGPARMPSGVAAVAFEVRDTGIGIDADVIGRLFEPFAQADSTISRRFGGTGLGLSITRHLVELLGGTVELVSQRGRGTTVRFVLPFAVTASPQTTSIVSQVSLAGTRVLVMDDRMTNREGMIANVVGCGARVDSAASETELLEMLDQAMTDGEPFHTIIVDRVRPRCDSLHLCRNIRNNSKFDATHIIALMSPNWNSNPADQQALRSMQFLSKPTRRTDLLAALARSRNPDVQFGGLSHVSSAGQRQKVAIAPSLGLRVLLVEDNATNIEVAREYLNELDCRVTVAINGIEAITIYDQANFDIILMDTQMPELDGLSATRRIRESERLKGRGRVPIVAVTANAYESDRAQAIEAGSDDFLSKPFTDQQLRAMLQKWGGRAEGAPKAGKLASRGSDVQTDAIVVGSETPERLTGQKEEPRLDDALHTVLASSRPAFLTRLLRAFLSSLPETAGALRAAVSQSDPELLRGVVHSLKSSSANVGAKRLSSQCRAIEMKLRFGANAIDCEALAAGVVEELGYVAQAFERMLVRLSEAAPAGGSQMSVGY
jgi:signal transduction histidine kinase/DNA-binding response OmpR family regulator